LREVRPVGTPAGDFGRRSGAAGDCSIGATTGGFTASLRRVSLSLGTGVERGGSDGRAGSRGGTGLSRCRAGADGPSSTRVRRATRSLRGGSGGSVRGAIGSVRACTP
jgi:hypothetical protein